jgi:hypothetical protein
MPRTRRSLLTALTLTALLGASALAAPPARALDLTGTWNGTLTCDGYDGQKDTFKITERMLINQTGTTLAVYLPDDDLTYAGGTIDDAVKAGKGEAFFIECDTRPDISVFSELVRGQVTTAANGTVTFKATSIFNDSGVAFGTCKWSLKRTNPATPTVPACQ